MNITEEDFTQAISKIESDTDVHLKINKKNFYAFYRYTSYNIEINGTKNSIVFTIKTTFNSHQIMTNTIILQNGMFYSPQSFIQEPNIFFLYIRGIADQMVKFHHNTISLDNFAQNVRNKKLDILTNDSDAN